MSTFNIRLNKEQEDRLIRESDELGITRGSLIKERVFGDVELTKKPRPDQVLLRRIIGDLGRAGNNLNQIARHVNSNQNSTYLKKLGRIEIELMKIRIFTLKALGINE